MDLDVPVETLAGVGPKRATLLANLGITTVRDLLFHFPRAYDDRRAIRAISSLQEGETVTVEAEVISSRMQRLRGRMTMAEVLLRDDTGELRATWFGRGFLAKTFVPGARGLFTGTIGKYKGLALRNPEYEMLSGDDDDRLHTGRIVPIYRLTEGLTQRILRQWLWLLLEKVGGFPDALPDALLRRHQYPAAADAIRAVHFPAELAEAGSARTRFAYEELLGIQLGVLRTRAAVHEQENGLRHTVGGSMLAALRAGLPFPLTAAQQRVIGDILGDMASPRPMLRLLQGDVGSGKTIVALHAIAAAADGGYQTALMAPTEVLAEQHFITLRQALEPLGLWVELLTGSRRGGAEIRRRIARGDAHVVVGTHALIQDKVGFHALGLAIIDEQHRFGVCQRARLVDKGLNPDILHMTATPIPRTLAITVYGGMDISLIDEMPPGRMPVKTRRISADKVGGMYDYILEQTRRGFQTYYICPLVEESDKRELTAVTSHFQALSAGPFSGIRTGVIHGRLAPDEKDDLMRRFKARQIDVLFSTTVIEVGVDVAAATTIVIEDAAQFGLTQLHQLRGRVGRGSEQSWCFLLGESKTDEGRQRLNVMCATTSGFEIAEQDLQLRGPGEFHGIRQAGLSDLRVADLIRDARLLDQARRDAAVILRADPALAAPELQYLAAAAARFQSLIA